MSHLPSEPQNSIYLDTNLREAIERYITYETEQRELEYESDRWIELSFFIDDVSREIATMMAWVYERRPEGEQ